MNSYDRYWRLIQSFHVMRCCPNLKQADGPQVWLDAMWTWLNTPGDFDMDHGSQCAVLFLLNVWRRGGNGDVPWPPFDMFHAMTAWDEAHQLAFVGWCQNPVRP